MARIYSSIDELTGNTPIMRLVNIEKKRGLKCEILAKLEFMNPGGSAKDRAAKYMLDGAEKRGLIEKGSLIIEPTSGNTGIGLAAAAAARGYKLIIVMPDNMSPERIAAMRAYGAEVVLTPGALGMKGAIEKAEMLHRENPGSIIAGQFENPDNAKAHYETTGPEIWADCGGELDALVCTVGTGGTITGTGRFLKEQSAGIKVFAVEPEGSPFLSCGIAGSHKIQGIGAGFLPELLDTGVYDEVLTVTDDAAYTGARVLAAEEGLLCGISSGAALSAALSLAGKDEFSGRRIVVILPDTGNRYLSGDLF